MSEDPKEHKAALRADLLADESEFRRVTWTHPKTKKELEIEIRCPTTAEIDAAVKKYTKDGETDAIKLGIHQVCMHTYDPVSGERIFGREDTEVLLQKPPSPASLVGFVQRHLKEMLSKEAVDAAGEKFAKN